jgi:hypothetical protein
MATRLWGVGAYRSCAGAKGVGVAWIGGAWDGVAWDGKVYAVELGGNVLQELLDNKL